MSDWGKGSAIPRWPKPTADEPQQRFSADLQEYDGSWTNLISNVPLRDAIAAARKARQGQRVAPETRVR